MRIPVFVSLGSIFLCACGPEEPVVAASAACPITAPTRLVAAPDGFEPAEDAWYGLYRFDDDILFTFDRFDDPEREYWHMNRCPGEVEPYTSLAPGLHLPYVVETSEGRIVYGADDLGRPYVIDRLDEPGADEARPVTGLPEDLTYIPYSRGGTAIFFEFWTSGSRLANAAGLDSVTYAIYSHAGDPDVPALLLSDQLLRGIYVDDTHMLAHEEGGEVVRIDQRTGEREVLVTDARHLDYEFGGRSFIWQAIGDDSVEPVYLHDLETGEDVEIAVNEFAAMSWGRDPDSKDNGEWRFTRTQEPPFAAAMICPGNRYAAAVRLVDGEALEVPPHIEQRGSFGGYFRLLLASDGDFVEALWDPRTGSVRESYRGPVERIFPMFADDDVAEYYEPDADAAFTGDLVRVDLATGENVRLLRDVGSMPWRFAENSYLVETPRERLEGPDTEVTGFLVRELVDLAVVDTASGDSTPIADRISERVIMPGEGLVFLDVFGPEPGLWAHPLPYAATRAGGPELGREVGEPVVFGVTTSAGRRAVGEGDQRAAMRDALRIR